ncbi:MAG: inverse autotransporter beta domain-containing protein [Chlamydiota bacterium]
MRYIFFGLTYYTLALPSSAFTQETGQGSYYYAPTPSKNPYPYGPKKETTSPTPPTHKDVKTPHSFRFSLTHREANGIGYDQGFSSLDGFFLFSSMGNWYPFFDVRAHLFNNGRPAANLGFGLRYSPDSVRAVFGINGFLDFKNTRHSTFEQAGAGIEILGTKWEMRANGYLPIFSKNNLYNLGFYRFHNHHAIFRASHEIAFKGFDLSLTHFFVQKPKWDLSSTLDGYMFFADYDTRAAGGLVKLKSTFFRFFSVETQASYDNYFKTILQLQAGVAVPFGKRITMNKKNLPNKQKLALTRRLSEEVDRFEMIVTTKHPINSIAKDPRTGKNLHIVFVNNQTYDQGDGNGTAESPFTSLAKAEKHSSPWDMIYVYPGNGSSFQMNSGITLQNGQWLQSSSFSFITDSAFGLSIVPNQTDVRPNIGNMTGASVTLANDNIVEGFTMRSPLVNISGTDITNARLSNNYFRNSEAFDVSLTNPSGNILLVNNISFSKNGLFLHSENDTHLLLQANDFANQGTLNMDIAFSGSSNGTVIIEHRNEFHDSLEGSLITAKDYSVVNCSLNETLFTAIPDGTPYCIKIIATDYSTLTAVVNENLFASSAPGLALETNLFATANWFVVNNTGFYTGHFSPMYPFGFATNDSSTATLLLAANSASNNGYELENNSLTATFNVESPTGTLSGVELINTGSFTTSGTLTFVPYDPGAIPIIE